MKTKRAFFYGFLALSMNQCPAVAATFSYQCTISGELHLQSDGTLKQYPQPISTGKKFAVDRRTGALVGPDLSLWAFSDGATTVLARGNRDNSFVVSYISPAAAEGVHTTVLRVEEFAQSARKPFTVFSGAGIYSGLCE